MEASPAGLEHLAQRNLSVSTPPESLPQADAVILAVPDVAIEKVSAQVVAQMKPGALLMALDPAAPLDDKLASRPDIAVFLAHPCHPSIFNCEESEEATRDFYGGASARQSIMCPRPGHGRRLCARRVSGSRDIAPSIAVLFGEVDGGFSDTAYKISARARTIPFREGWQSVFEMGDVREQVRSITQSE